LGTANPVKRTAGAAAYLPHTFYQEQLLQLEEEIKGARSIAEAL
jgi:hypothetical protein